MAPGQVLFDQAGLGWGKVGGRGIGKSAAVRGLERGTSFREVREPYLQATPARLSLFYIRRSIKVETDDGVGEQTKEQNWENAMWLVTITYD